MESHRSATHLLGVLGKWPDLSVSLFPPCTMEVHESIYFRDGVRPEEDAGKDLDPVPSTFRECQ